MTYRVVLGALLSLVSQADGKITEQEIETKKAVDSVEPNPQNNYEWIFGDGSVAYTANHFQTFSHPGYYSASLTVSNKQADCVETRKEDLLVGRKSPGGKAGFIYVAGEGNQVAFSNQSLGTDLNFLWNFNDSGHPFWPNSIKVDEIP